MNKLYCLLALALSPAFAAELGTSTFSLRAEPGSHPVGFKVIEQYDFSRSFKPLIDDLGEPSQGERARPVQTLIWYPAQSAAGSSMTFRDYVNLGLTETSFESPQPAAIGEWFFRSLEPSLSSPMWAHRDAPTERDRFPVLIYAPSFSSNAWENTDLCEYIASFGYVVIASPGMGVRRQSTHDLSGIDAQARDISFLIGYAQTLPNADTSEVAVAGFSWGGISELFAAAKDDRIKALVAYDGSMRYWPGLVKQSADVNPAKMTLPLLFFKAQFTPEDQAQLNARIHSVAPSVPREDAYVLNDWVHGDLFSVQMLGMVHPEFSSIAHRNEQFWKDEFDHLQEADYDRADGMVGYSWVVRYTEKFLDAYLKRDPEALKYLKSKPGDNVVPPHVMATSFRAAEPPPVSFDSFKVAVAHAGFSHASAVYAKFHKEHPDFQLDKETMDAWGNALIASSHFSEAVEVMKLNVQQHSSSGTYVSLAEAYRVAGEMGEAVANYKQALKSDPNNKDAYQRLTALQQKVPRQAAIRPPDRSR
jgi:dienelactone hydrolase